MKQPAWLRGRRLQAAWHVLRGHGVIWRAVLQQDHVDPRRLHVAHYQGSKLHITQSVINFTPHDYGQAEITRKQMQSRPIPPTALVDPQGNVWDTNGW
ncbi:MAG TPA: hypothetical protein VGL75_07380 [Acidothermaceae bacterium]|jgi:hypothetical protein